MLKFFTLTPRIGLLNSICNGKSPHIYFTPHFMKFWRSILALNVGYLSFGVSWYGTLFLLLLLEECTDWAHFLIWCISQAVLQTKGVHFCSTVLEKLSSKLALDLSTRSGWHHQPFWPWQFDLDNFSQITWALLTGCFSPWRCCFCYYCYCYSYFIVIIIYYYIFKVRDSSPMRCTLAPCPVETPVSRFPAPRGALVHPMLGLLVRWGFFCASFFVSVCFCVCSSCPKALIFQSFSLFSCWLFRIVTLDFATALGE